MRIHQSHQRQKSIVRNSENPGLAIGFRNIFDEPVDGVVSVRRMIDGSGIERPVKRAIHDVVALRIVLSAHILHHADVAAFDDHVAGIVVTIENGTEMGTIGVSGQLSGAVWSAREQYRRVVCAFWDQDDGEKFHAVTHGDHDFVASVIKTVRDLAYGIRRFAGKRLRGGGSGSLRGRR